ncbi:MAG: hypothetical protein GY771_02190 [bacterium]|nr:hypothetical protein [bacterium]
MRNKKILSIILPLCFAFAAFGNIDCDECPDCGSYKNVVPISYTRPESELTEKEKSGEVPIQNCLVWDNLPMWHCRKCLISW